MHLKLESIFLKKKSPATKLGFGLNLEIIFSIALSTITLNPQYTILFIFYPAEGNKVSNLNTKQVNGFL